MFRGLYSAASALDAASQAQAITAHNLAHASTPGYRQRGVVYETFDRVLGRTLEPTGDLVGTRLAEGYSDFRTGPIQQTGAPFDVALNDPDRFFAVNDPNGRTLYTRDGAFRLNGQGQLITVSGYVVQGDGGPITIPQAATQINIASDGNITADGAQVARLRVVQAGDPKQLVPVGDTLFEAPDEAGIQVAESRVLQGYREGSNVNPAEAMTGMVIAARFYDATQRVLRTIAETVQLNTRPNQ